jgi:hypothetical protein
LSGIDGALSFVCDGMQNITKIGEKHLLKKYGDFMWITDLPRILVPFYQAKQPKINNVYFIIIFENHYHKFLTLKNIIKGVHIYVCIKQLLRLDE